ncbi:cytochrome oxidase assembly protein 1, partial [Mycena rosella]
MVLGLTAVVLSGWAAFLTYVTNETKVTSSVVKQILRTIKGDPQLAETLGLAIRPQPEWWLNGYPIIHGQINQLQGNIDVSFRIKGSMGVSWVVVLPFSCM